MKATRLQLALGFGCIYLLWGSTYLAIRWSVATIPPFVMGATRFLIAGSLLYAWSRLRGAAKPTARHWRNAAIIGVLLLLIGNGAVAWSEQRVSSGLTALVAATVPLWVVLAELFQGRRPAALQWVGVAIGLAGVGLLVMPAQGLKGEGIDPVAALVVTIGSLSWTVGSLYSRTAQLPQPATLASGMQMLCGGLALLTVSVLSGEWMRVDVSAISVHSMLAVTYLIVFGSLIGFSTYMWLLKVASPAAVGTYAYVNPAVAVLLGVLLAGESLPPRALAAMLVILGGVALVSLAPPPRRL